MGYKSNSKNNTVKFLASFSKPLMEELQKRSSELELDVRDLIRAGSKNVLSLSREEILKIIYL